MDDHEELYRAGHKAGLTGIRQKMPEDIYHDPDNSYRDAWRDGYRDGLREYKKNLMGFSAASVANSPLVHDRLWFDPPDAHGFISIRDGENGTVLCKFVVNPEPRIVIPHHNVTPEMAYLISRAVMKASTRTYRVKADRELRPSKRSDIWKKGVHKQRGADTHYTPRAEFLNALSDRAFHLSKNIRKLYWLVRQHQGESEEHLTSKVAAEWSELSDGWREYTATDWQQDADASA